MTLKELRTQKGLTQKECADYLQVPYRTYVRYEHDGQTNANAIKYQYMLNKLSDYGLIDETHGILTIEQIKQICSDIFPAYSVNFAYLFGSYAKNKATELSDIDLLVSTETSGLKFYELVEVLREKLGKQIDLLDIAQLENNTSLTQEILKDGIKIYG